MASDEIVWQIINQKFCAYKLKTTKGQNFCRNEYSVTGLCNRQSCPLANSSYATVRSSPNGVIYLYQKTIERAHMPSKLWSRIRLDRNYQRALEQIEQQLQFAPPFLRHKCKQRLTRLVQTAIRMRRIAADEQRLGEKLVPKLAPKIKNREAARERKAERAAKLERTIERELIERLRQGAYGDQPLNVSEAIWKKVLKGLERQGEGVRDKDHDKGIEAEEAEAEEESEMEEEDLLEAGAVEYVSDLEESDAELADMEDWLGSDDDDEDEDDADEDGDDDDDGDEEKKKTKVGDKRKRTLTARVKARKKHSTNMEVEHEAKAKVLAW